MEIGQTLLVTDRKRWRAWLAKHHRTAPDIWLIYFKKSSGKRRIPYNDAVEEALCYGWIDSIVKPMDADRFAQRFSPRRKKSVLSELNKERIRRLIRSRKMTRFGLERISHHLEPATPASGRAKTLKEFAFPADILQRLRQDTGVWKNFQAFPESYRRVRVGWIDAARERRELFETRLRYFLKMTARNKRYGMLQ